MKLYLVRHGEATDAAENINRPLSEKGLKEANLVANFLKEKKISIQQIYHSGVLRAEQTAQAFANQLDPHPPLKKIDGLLPEDPVKSIAVYCNQWQENVMLIGHLPFMGRLASEILFGRDNWQCFEFHTASVLCLERIAVSQWGVAWFIPPYLIKINID